jgi:hypothetical protein
MVREADEDPLALRARRRMIFQSAGIASSDPDA